LKFEFLFSSTHAFLLTFRDYSLLSKGMSVLTMVANKNYTHVLVNRFFLGV